ncbi:hypothetical protein EDC04DRAFT_2602104 [Pisolithus marmoratus]|nr:hypothetical protein EDC04DRAFT_2602104 [Pisolithus marmoratus]
MSFASSSNAGAPDDWDLYQGNHGRQPKATLQREYRKREGDVFNELRDIIKQFNDFEPATRHETLSEASRLLRQLGTENANLRRQLSAMPPTRGNGANNMGIPAAPPAHTDSTYGPRGGPWAANHGYAHTNNAQAPDTSSQSHALNFSMPPGSMPEIEELLRVVDEDIRRSNNTHPYHQYYRN